jgi:hypothetical protein
MMLMAPHFAILLFSVLFLFIGTHTLTPTG